MTLSFDRRQLLAGGGRADNAAKPQDAGFVAQDDVAIRTHPPLYPAQGQGDAYRLALGVAAADGLLIARPFPSQQGSFDFKAFCIVNFDPDPTTLVPGSGSGRPPSPPATRGLTRLQRRAPSWSHRRQRSLGARLEWGVRP